MSTTTRMSNDPIVFLDTHGTPGAEYGTRPVLRYGVERCPKCGARAYGGYGFGFGPGIGTYRHCSKECGWFWKRVDPE